MASSSRQEDGDTAPIYTIPSRRLGALEHPMIIKNLDKGIKTFGQNNAFQAILDSASPQISVPLYLRYDNPSARPLTSHNALTHNVVVKVTVPKRTGRKRRRGTDGPWEGDVEQPAGEDSFISPEVLSRDRRDTPRVIRRRLQDNVGNYTVEPIGVINNTHRYRGLADFQYALGESKFMKKFVEKVLPGDVAKLKEFSLQPGIESGTNIDLIPPPYFTPISLPFGYNYAQNPHTKEVSPGLSDASGTASEDQEYARVVNVTSRVPAAGYFIAHDEYPVPTAPRRQPDMSDPQVAAIITEMRLAMDERPIWTRRSMWNRLGAKFAELPKNGGLVRHCLQYAGYQFKGGPWRDALVKYGLDPRADPRYRVYQTLIFKLHKTRIGSVGRSWQAVRRKEISVTNFGKAWQEIGGGDGALLNTHVFNGEAFSTDGKVWQVCDITDPLLATLFADAEIRSECDAEISGFYGRVLWSVAKAIMKCKMVAIRFDRKLTDNDFSAALEATKGVPHDGGDGGGGGPGNSIGISLPDLHLTAAEYEQLRGGKYRPRPGIKSSGREVVEGVGRRRKTHYRVRIPLKEAEDREAVKMIRLLTQNAQDKRVADEAAAGGAYAGVVDMGVKESSLREPLGGAGEVPESASAREEEEEEGDERDQEQRDGRAFQEILEDMEEEGSEDEDDEDEESEEGEEEEEEAATPRKRPPFQEREGEDELEQEEEYEEGGYSDEDDQADMEEEDEEEDEYAGGEDGEEGFVDEEEEYYDEEGGGFPQPWEDGAGASGGAYGNGFYE
ncbi:transcription factor tau subunit sfc1 [Chaetomidium leptoderma]|uniref:Transcription factor tau subunit sfc1 n=1 Tax=Chaetomidium leptoderma TaxID=669021 RepID=A0AAN6VQJ5_9PEZI|nr:transcription factor tau subunit sfc1 [Chaetomidium leptoderma]